MENDLFLSLCNCNEAWEIVKRSYLVAHKTAPGSYMGNSKEKPLQSIKDDIEPERRRFTKCLRFLIHICILLVDVQTQQRQRSQQQPVPIAHSSSRSANSCVPAVKTVSPTALQL